LKVNNNITDLRGKRLRIEFIWLKIEMSLRLSWSWL
jgi:hypothetical protein